MTGLALPDVTLVTISSVHLHRSAAAMHLSMRHVDFGDAVLITHARPAGIDPRIRLATVPRLTSIDDYNRFVVFELWRHVATSHCLIVQADGFVLDPRAWDDRFLEFDYIGAPWPLSDSAYVDPFGHHQRVGNGGFSLRSHRLLTVPQRAHVEWEVNQGSFYRHMGAGLYSEDGCICVHNRHVYEADGCVFAPVEIAACFSQETPVPESRGIVPFGFHKYDPRTGRKRRAPAWRGWALTGRASARRGQSG